MSLVIVHYQPLEKYPPIINMLNYLSDIGFNKKVYVFSTQPPTGFALFKPKSNNIEIRRTKPVANGFIVKKILSYFSLYFNWFWQIKKVKPSSILYYETWSCYPVYLYSLINSSSKIFIHYHEYTSKEEYANSAGILKILHKAEQKIFSKTSWLSHTNDQRLNLFLKDENITLNKNIHHTLPNYPSKKWATNYVLQNKTLSNPVKFVYIGSLGLNTMYVKEFAAFILSCNGNAIWDIYTNQFNDKAIQYLQSLQSTFISVKGSVEYINIPKTVFENKYDVGVILYNGHIKNYIYNAPNKLFEYLACGLHVWYPNVMVGCKEYNNEHKSSIVFEIDFLQDIKKQFQIFIDKTLVLKKADDSVFFYENIYNKLVEQIT